MCSEMSYIIRADHSKAATVNCSERRYEIVQIELPAQEKTDDSRVQNYSDLLGTIGFKTEFATSIRSALKILGPVSPETHH